LALFGPYSLQELMQALFVTYLLSGTPYLLLIRCMSMGFPINQQQIRVTNHLFIAYPLDSTTQKTYLLLIHCTWAFSTFNLFIASALYTYLLLIHWTLIIFHPYLLLKHLT